MKEEQKSLLSNIQKGLDARSKNPMILFYAPEKFGKSTFASQADNPIFLTLEEGLIGISVDSTPLIRDYDTLNSWLRTLYKDDHKYKTVVLDTITSLEDLLINQVCSDLKITKEEFSSNTDKRVNFGRGNVLVKDYVSKIYDALNHLRTHKGMTVILLGHAKTKEVPDPQNEKIEKYTLQFGKNGSEFLFKNMDIILFGHEKIKTKAGDKGFDGETKKVAIKGLEPEKILYTGSTPSCVCGNRYCLPREIALPGSDDIGSMYATFKKELDSSIAKLNGKGK